MTWINKNASCVAVLALGLSCGFGCGDDSETSGSGGGSSSTGATGTASSTATGGTAASTGSTSSPASSGTGGEGTGGGAGGDGAGGDGTGGNGTGGDGTGGDGTGGGTIAPVGSSTGNITECQPDAESCNDPCAEARDAGPGNCMVFVSNRYSMLVEPNNVDQCGVHVGLNFNGGSPAAGEHAVVGVNDFTAGTVAVDWTGGPDGSIEFAESGTVTVTIDGTEITGTFEDLPFPGGGTVSGEITCH